MAISPWQESVSSEPAGLQPEQMGQIRDSCRIFRPQSVPHQGRWLWMPHFTKLLFPLCLYPGYPIHRAAAYDTTLTTLHCPHSCAAAITAPPLWNQAHPSTPQSPCQEKLPPPPQVPTPGDVSLNAPTAPTSGTTLALEPPVTQAVVPEPLSPLPASPHPCCESQPPKCFEPETGLWVPRRVRQPMLAYSFPE